MDSSCKCEQCGMVTKTKRGLKLHMKRMHSGENDKTMFYHCSHCGRAFSNQSLLLQHMKIHGDRPYQCLQCGNAFLYNNELIVHMRNHTGETAYQCKLCRDHFSNNAALSRHTVCHHGECNHCKKVFLYKNDVLKHMMVGIYSSEKQCGKCHVVFACRSERELHLECNYKCRNCGEAFISIRELVVHLMTENNDFEKQCFKCDVVFGCHSDRKVHLECLKCEEEESFVTQNNYKCTHCDEAFTSNKGLEVHLMAHISPIDGKNPDKEYFQYRCGQCTISFKHKTDYIDHTRTHCVKEKPYQCTHCNESFLFKDKCIAHMKIHGKIPYKCVQCGQAFSYKGDLIAHMKVHGKKSYQCIQCGEEFSYYSDLAVHRRSHTSKVYQCKYCSLVFSDARYLGRHMADHTAEQEYIKKCEKLGLHSVNPDLKSSSVRTGGTEPPYQCKLCERTYKSKFGFISHIKKHVSDLDTFDMQSKSMNEIATKLNVPKDCANGKNGNGIGNSNYIFKIDHANEGDVEVKEEQIDDGYKSLFEFDREFRGEEYDFINIQNGSTELEAKVEIKEEEICS